MSDFRDFSLFVDEHSPGHFHWVIEGTRDGTMWETVKSGDRSYPSSGEALERGSVELRKLNHDLLRSRPHAPDDGAAPASP